MMMMIFLLITNPLYLNKGTMHRIMTILQRIVCHTHHPDSKGVFPLLKDNRRLCRGSLVMSGIYL
jgi:hypothetical protein